MTPAKILLLVEGGSVELSFFSRYAEYLGLSVEIVPYRTNIYKLYELLKADDFAQDVCTILRGWTRDAAEKALLSQKYSGIYLIYDAELQHCDKGCQNLGIFERVKINLPRLKQMIEYFNDDTDDARGKLFVNYPMMEAYKDCDSFFEDAYADAEVNIADLMDNKYKQHVSQHKVNGIPLKKLDIFQFRLMIKAAIFKAVKIVKGTWGALPYNDFLKEIGQMSLYAAELDSITTRKAISVVNTSVLLAVDHCGNKNGFYDQTV